MFKMLQMYRNTGKIQRLERNFPARAKLMLVPGCDRKYFQILLFSSNISRPLYSQRLGPFVPAVPRPQLCALSFPFLKPPNPLLPFFLSSNGDHHQRGGTPCSQAVQSLSSSFSPDLHGGLRALQAGENSVPIFGEDPGKGDYGVGLREPEFGISEKWDWSLGAT